MKQLFKKFDAATKRQCNQEAAGIERASFTYDGTWKPCWQTNPYQPFHFPQYRGSGLGAR
jgi:hypothetical protein